MLRLGDGSPARQRGLKASLEDATAKAMTGRFAPKPSQLHLRLRPARLPFPTPANEGVAQEGREVKLTPVDRHVRIGVPTPPAFNPPLS